MTTLTTTIDTTHVDGRCDHCQDASGRQAVATLRHGLIIGRLCFRCIDESQEDER